MTVGLVLIERGDRQRRWHNGERPVSGSDQPICRIEIRSINGNGVFTGIRKLGQIKVGRQPDRTDGIPVFQLTAGKLNARINWYVTINRRAAECRDDKPGVKSIGEM